MKYLMLILIAYMLNHLSLPIRIGYRRHTRLSDTAAPTPTGRGGAATGHVPFMASAARFAPASPVMTSADLLRPRAPRHDCMPRWKTVALLRSTIIKRRRPSLATAWFDLAQRSIDMMQGSATVIATRTAAMAKTGAHPSAAHEREMKRMVDEKVDASAASLAGMAFTAAASCQSFWLGALWGGRAPSTAQLQRATTRVLGAGLAPYQKTVRSNVRRLRK